MGKKVLIGALAALGAMLVALAVYVAYVMLGYYRLEDNLALPVQPPASEIAEALPQLELTDELTPLTVVAANLGFGAYGPDFDFFMDGGTGSVARSAEYVRANILGSAEAIKSLDPDFVLFQEVDVQGTRSHNVDEYALLVDAFPNDASVFAQNYDSPYLAWPPYAPHGANRAGMVTFSDCAIADALRRSLPISDSFSKLLDLDRCYSIVRIPTSADVDLVLFNVHLSAYGADAQIMQAQRDMLYADMQKERDAGNFVIAGGDFNHDMIGVSNEVYGNATDTEASWAKPFDFASVPSGFTVVPKAQLDSGTFASLYVAMTTILRHVAFSIRLWIKCIVEPFAYCRSFNRNITCLSPARCETISTTADAILSCSNATSSISRFSSRTHTPLCRKLLKIDRCRL